jgi:putative transposase
MPWINYPFKMEKQYRRQGWDYSNPGYYFITICTKDRINLFRNIIISNPVGTDLCVCSSPSKHVCSSPSKHVCSSPSKHVCSLNKKKTIVGNLNPAGKMVEKWWREIPNKFKSIELDKYIVMPNHFHGILIIKNVPLIKEEQTHRSVPTIDHNIFGNIGLLGQSIQWFKTMTTNEYIKNVKQNNWPRFCQKLWQSRFHDRIIRSEKEYWAKRIYIEDNPKNWNKDKNNLL